MAKVQGNITERQLQRRKEIAKAMWSVITRDGIDKASVRAIAAELGTTIGVLTHYFQNKEELLIFALDEFLNKMEQAMTSGARGKKGMDRLVNILCAALPLDAERLSAWKVWMSFVVHAFNEGRPRTVFQKRYLDIRNQIIRDIKQLQNDGIVNPNLDPKLETFFLIALIDGIAVRTAMGPEHLTKKVLIEQFSAQVIARLTVKDI